ncbi:hypothetical protein, partial [Hydrogenibacillus schlegelii]
TAETGQFSLVDLQEFSGHRDVRMLLRYSHLCTTKLAHRLDAAFADGGQRSTTQVHRGRLRLRAGQELSVATILADAPEAAQPKPVEPARSKPALVSNVITFPGARAAGGIHAGR